MSEQSVLMRPSKTPSLHAKESLSALRDNLFRYCLAMSGSREDAEDIVQTTLLKTLPVVTGEQMHPNVSALLKRVAKTTWLDALRKQRKLQVSDTLVDLASRTEDDSAHDLDVDAALSILVMRLTPQQRLAVLLCDVFQFTALEAAELMGTSHGAVKATLHRARARLVRSRLSLADKGDLSATEKHMQVQILMSYARALADSDIQALVHLCQGEGGDPVAVTQQVLTLKGQQGDTRTHPVHSLRTRAHLSLLAA
jgi:RNA polymerase sigma factor (sigma-70 family)